VLLIPGFPFPGDSLEVALDLIGDAALKLLEVHADPASLLIT
jgi:hypothetical protein